MIIYNNILPPKKYKAVTLWPFIFVRKGNRLFEWDENHEKIHLRQQIEMLVIPFYLIYLINYLVLFVKYWDRSTAYKNICFEKEAYQMEYDRNYLKKRKFWAWIKYF